MELLIKMEKVQKRQRLKPGGRVATAAVTQEHNGNELANGVSSVPLCFSGAIIQNYWISPEMYLMLITECTDARRTGFMDRCRAGEQT